MKEEKENTLSTLCCMSPSNLFYTAITNPSFNKISRKSLVLILFFSFMWIEKELMDDLSASKNEARKLKTLALCFHRLQLKGKALLGFSRITKEDCDEFKSHPRH